MNQQLRFTVPRYNYKATDEIWFDEYGFLVVPEYDSLRAGLIDLDAACKLPGGILISEGGTGKSYYARTLCYGFA